MLVPRAACSRRASAGSGAAQSRGNEGVLSLPDSAPVTERGEDSRGGRVEESTSGHSPHY